MKIIKVEVFGIKLDLKKPFIVSYDRYDDMPTIITRIETEDGTVGWGEAVPDQHVTSETWESTFQILKNELAVLVMGENPFNINSIHQKMNEKILDAPSAKAAIDIALYDLMGKLSNQPVYRLIGGRSHKELQIPQVISILSPEKMAEEAEQIVSEGYHHIKIKVGTDAETDIKRIRAVREAIPAEAKLRVDANQGWKTAEAIYVINQTRDCNVGWYEQPVKANDHLSLAEIRKATNVNIMADEGIHGPHELLNIIQLRAADMVNIKLMKTGGIYPALALANLAEAAGMPCQFGSMVESAIGTMAGAHLSLSQTIIESNEMVGPLMFSEDVAETKYINGTLEITDTPGLGIKVNESMIREKAILHCTVN
ncbi:mandelate racemase/muconate lactonizing enzyme family protein [Virgibacillus sp. W0181]|uniref:mandelate racemase/muconate lactonizing enzyme family protein n=1 Tax=Virgibacillus sp. W0181 TaxID=3391581 RepID=UPI003F4890E0